MLKVLVSGGFDPLHIGHVQLFIAAKKLGDYLIVLINNDNWLMAKKGFVFMDENERKAIIEALRDVDEARLTGHPESPEDMSVAKELEEIRPDVFANGGDRNEADAANPESSLFKDIKTCERVGIKMVYNVGGGKAQSSSELVHRALGIKSKTLK
ncbi:MAG: adenylyltransferase/cytidyltransferase family protein [Patescibacteria group bacterium]